MRITAREAMVAAASCFGLWLVAGLPLFDQGYWLSLGVNIALYAALCSAWTLFSGPTRLISLATAAFFGIGAYVVGAGVDSLPFGLLLVFAALLGAMVAALVGLATLRLSGVYFVIFTLGLAELIRQIVTWVQVNFTSGVGLYVFTDYGEREIYWMLLGVLALIYLTGWLVNRAPLGFALRIIGDDETAAAHLGVDVAREKVLLFTISGAFISLIGAIMASRFAYIEPPSAFNPMISFQVVIMALMGGTRRLWSPLLGVIPFTLMWDQISARFPDHAVLLMGVAFMAVVYVIPHGVHGLIEAAGRKRRSEGAP